MITSKSYLILFYSLSFILFFNYTNPFIFWVMTELNLLLFILIVVMMDLSKFKQETHDLAIFYFIIQSLASIFILSDFFFSSEFYIFNTDTMFILSLLMKLGVFPFFFWVYKVSQFFSFKTMILLLTVQKIPFFLFLFNSTNIFVPFILTLSLISGTFLIIYSKDFMFMIVSSSLLSSYWLFYLYSYSLFFFLFYFVIYTFFITMLLSLYFSKSMNSFNSIFVLVLFTFLLGLSPLSLFFFKLYTMFFLFFNYKILEVVLFWFLSFMCLFGYVKFSYKVFFFNFGVYEIPSFFWMKTLFLSLSLMIFFIFLLY